MSKSKYMLQFYAQKSNAKKRGIEWQFTFEEWIAFWGDDINKRGTGHDRLCMQRFHDKGPYHPLNVKKGYARDNRKTSAAIQKGARLYSQADFHQSDEDWKVVHAAFFPESL
jgi:hypothetical protein